jgi:hypothetical protein
VRLRAVAGTLAVLGAGVAVSACGSSPSSLAPSKDLAPKPPVLSRFVPANERVTGDRQVQMTASGPPQVVVTAVESDTGLNNFVGERLRILSWDPFARRWTTVFDSKTALALYGEGSLDAPDASYSVSGAFSTGKQQAPLSTISDLHLVELADQPHRVDDLGFSAVPYSASGASVAGIIHYSGQTASLLWIYGSGEGETLLAKGRAPRQVAALSSIWETAADPHYGTHQRFTAEIALTKAPSGGQPSFTVIDDSRPWLGAWVYSAGPGVTTTLTPSAWGPATVIATTPGSPAAKVLQPGDEILGVQNTAPYANADLGPAVIDELAAHPAGSKVTLEVKRGAETLELPVTLGSRDAKAATYPEPPSPGYLDIGGETMTSALSTQYSLPNSAGVVLTEVGSGGAGDNAGLTQHDIITSIDGYAVTSIESLEVDEAIIGPNTKVPLDYVNPEGVSSTTNVTLGVPPANDSPTFDYL